jgi:undecaprenyl-diphosphatase
VSYLQILILAAVQGAAELLPVSSSAHVIVTEKLMGLDPTSPEMVFLLVMLHTGTMFAVIAYFWRSWRTTFFSDRSAFLNFLLHAIVATGLTGVVGYGLKKVIEHVFLAGVPHAKHGPEIETLFGNTLLIACALAAAGIFIIIAGMTREKHGRFDIGLSQSGAIGIVQGFCLPFRGFSRSGATISMGLLSGMTRQKAEQFSFALAVILTPVIIAMEGKRLLEANQAGAHLPIHELMTPGLVGMVIAFFAGLLALVVLSRLLEGGQWKLFGFYCLAAAGTVLFLHFHLGI